LRAALDSAVQEVLALQFASERPDSDFGNALAQKFLEDFSVLAPFIKDPSFAEEREWRIVSTELQADDPLIAVRPSRGILVPYYSFPLEDAEGVAAIERLWIGPMPHPQLAKRALDRFAALNSSLPIRQIGISQVPFRVVR
jgi:hypothetical protein